MGSGSHLPLYLSLIALEAGLLLGVRALGARRGESLRALAGAPPRPTDVAAAAGMWLGWSGIAWLVSNVLPASTPRVVGALLPRGAIESLAWVLLSIRAGIAEELAFRGYLQRRIGIAGQAISLASSTAIRASARSFASRCMDCCSESWRTGERASFPA